MMNQSLTTLVTDAQRDRAIDFLQHSFASGALDESELDTRLDQALQARTRAELNASLQGLARVAPSRALAVPRAYPPAVEGAANVGSGFVHLAGFVGGFIPAAVVKAAAPPGSRVWWEAGRALSFQLTSAIVTISLIILTGILGFGEALVGLSFLAWAMGNVYLAVRAFDGRPSTKPLDKVLLFKPRQPGV